MQLLHLGNCCSAVGFNFNLFVRVRLLRSYGEVLKGSYWACLCRNPTLCPLIIRTVVWICRLCSYSYRRILVSVTSGSSRLGFEVMDEEEAELKMVEKRDAERREQGQDKVDACKSRSKCTVARNRTQARGGNGNGME
jgi:hypothetical protein